VTEQPKQGGVLVVPVTAQPPDLDGTLFYNARIHAPISMIYNRVVKTKWGAGVPPTETEVVGDLAQGWEQPEPLTFVFKLHPNVRWQNRAPVNGRPFVAEDVQQTFSRILNPSLNSQLAGKFKGEVSAVETPNPTTVVFKLTQPYAEFLYSLAFHYYTIVPHELFAGDGLKTNPVGTGAFMLERFDKGETVVLKRNPEYWKAPKPYLESVEMRLIPTVAGQAASFVAGQIHHISDVTAQDLTQLTNQVKDAGVTKYATWTTRRLQLTPTRPPLNDPRVRLAIQKLIDQQQFTNVLWGSARWSGVMPVNMEPFALPEQEVREALKPDVAEAKKLLDGAGYDYNQTLELAWNQGYGTSYESMATIVQQQLMRGNVKTRITSYAQAEFLARWNPPWDKNQLAVGPLNFNGTPDGLFTAYHPAGEFYFQDVRDPRLIEMVERQRRIVNQNERVKYVQDIQRYMQTQNVIDVSMGLPEFGSITRPNVRDFHFRLTNTAFPYMEDAWFA
jgi:peptide/nickel transport system substrate-binding protein